MVSLTYAITKTPIIFSVLTPNNNNSSKNTSVSVPPLPPRSKRKPQELTISRTTTQSPPPTTTQPKPSVAEIERAIGAGVFRDRDTDSGSEQSKTLFDSILSNSIGKSEGSVEKKLRETGEWILDRTEGSSSSGSAGKQILKGVFLLILPMWMLSFLVASGLIKLPFDTPFLDDLIM